MITLHDFYSILTWFAGSKFLWKSHKKKFTRWTYKFNDFCTVIKLFRLHTLNLRSNITYLLQFRFIYLQSFTIFCLELYDVIIFDSLEWSIQKIALQPCFVGNVLSNQRVQKFSKQAVQYCKKCWKLTNLIEITHFIWYSEQRTKKPKKIVIT